jgi:hypothetical protein
MFVRNGEGIQRLRNQPVQFQRIKHHQNPSPKVSTITLLSTSLIKHQHPPSSLKMKLTTLLSIPLLATAISAAIIPAAPVEADLAVRSPPHKTIKREASPPHKTIKREASPPHKTIKREASPPHKTIKRSPLHKTV